PGVEHREAPDLGTEMLGVSGDVLERLRHGTKEQPIEGARVLERQGGEVMREGKDDMRVGRLEHLAFPGGEPRGLRGAMAFGAAAVPARVVRLDLVATLVALGDMAAEGG